MNRWRVQLLLLLLWVPFRTTTADLGDVVGLWRWRLMLPAGSSKVNRTGNLGGRFM